MIPRKGPTVRASYRQAVLHDRFILESGENLKGCDLWHMTFGCAVGMPKSKVAELVAGQTRGRLSSETQSRIPYVSPT